MKRCKCEHWQTCPTCYPQGFDEHGARKPVEIPSSREELQREITALREQVEKLTKERDTLTKTLEFMEHTRDVEHIRHREMSTAKREQLTALAEQVETLQSDADRLDFLDRNLAFNTGWSVGIAPVGLISVTAVGLRKTTIREAIDNARNEK